MDMVNDHLVLYTSIVFVSLSDLAQPLCRLFKVSPHDCNCQHNETRLMDCSNADSGTFSYFMIFNFCSISLNICSRCLFSYRCRDPRAAGFLSSIIHLIFPLLGTFQTKLSVHVKLVSNTALRYLSKHGPRCTITLARNNLSLVCQPRNFRMYIVLNYEYYGFLIRIFRFKWLLQ